MNALYVPHWNTSRLPAQFTLIANVHYVTFAPLVKRKLCRVTTRKIACANHVPMKLLSWILVRTNALHVGSALTMSFKHKHATEQLIEIALTVLQMLFPKATIMA